MVMVNLKQFLRFRFQNAYTEILLSAHTKSDPRASIPFSLPLSISPSQKENPPALQQVDRYL